MADRDCNERGRANEDACILPEFRIVVTRKMVVMGATSSRDWQPIHYDSAYARENAALPDIIMNNYTQAGWLSRYVTDWSGPKARLARLKFSMRSPLCPGDEAVFSGLVQKDEQRDGFRWVQVAVKVHVSVRLATKAELYLAFPADEKAASPWECADNDWKP